MNLFTEEAKRQGFSVPLHALRGIAAIIVLFKHIQDRLSEAFAHIALPHIINAGAAVNFFYVLSGLVVGASLAKVGVSSSSVSVFFHRRFFRIMPLMFISVSLGGLYLLYIDPHMRYSYIPKDYGEFDLLKFVSGYIGYSMKPNPPIWSIFVELVASLLIPLMILSGNKAMNILLALVGCILLSLIPLQFQHCWNFYMISFFVGLTLLAWGKWLAERMAGLANSVFWLVIALLFVPFYLARIIAEPGFGELWIVYWETAFVAPFVAIVFYMPERFSWLCSGALKFFGDISFSLYLTHFILLILILHGVTGLMGVSGIAAIVFCVTSIIFSVLAAYVFYHQVELKGIRFGESLRKKSKPVETLA